MSGILKSRSHAFFSASLNSEAATSIAIFDLHQLGYIAHSVLGTQNHANVQNLLAREREHLSPLPLLLSPRNFSLHGGRERREGE